MSLSFASYATDEDVAVRAPGDYSVLCPAWQTLSAGGDGVFAGGSPWVLSSASAGFSGQGAAAGHVVLLSGPKPQFKGTGLLFAVDSAAAGTLFALNLGTTIPPVGALVLLTFVANRWVFRWDL